MASRKNGRDRRDAILDAALECFSRQGLFETGIEDVRKAAGASPSSVYHLFDGMNDIIAGVLERTFQRLYGAMDAAVQRETEPEALVRAAVTTQLDWVIENRGEARFMYQALALEISGPQRAHLRKVKTELRAPMMQRLLALAVPAEVATWPPYMLDTVVFGPAHQACRYLLTGAPADLDWLRRELPAIAWRSIASASGIAQTRPARSPTRRAVPRRARR